MALLQRRFFLGILILITLLHVAQSVSVFREPFRWIKKRLFKLKDPIDDPAYTVWAKGLGRWTRKAEHGVPILGSLKDRDFWIYKPIEGRGSEHYVTNLAGVSDWFGSKLMGGAKTSFAQKAANVMGSKAFGSMTAFMRTVLPDGMSSLSEPIDLPYPYGSLTSQADEISYILSIPSMGHAITYRTGLNLEKDGLDYLGIRNCETLPKNTELGYLQTSALFKIPFFFKLKIPKFIYRYKANFEVVEYMKDCKPTKKRGKLERYTRFPLYRRYLLTYNGREYWTIPSKWRPSLNGILKPRRWTIVQRSGTLGKKGPVRLFMHRVHNEIWRIIGDGTISQSAALMIFGAVRR